MNPGIRFPSSVKSSLEKPRDVVVGGTTARYTNLMLATSGPRSRCQEYACFGLYLPRISERSTQMKAPREVGLGFFHQWQLLKDAMNTAGTTEHRTIQYELSDRFADHELLALLSVKRLVESTCFQTVREFGGSLKIMH